MHHHVHANAQFESTGDELLITLKVQALQSSLCLQEELVGNGCWLGSEGFQKSENALKAVHVGL